MDAESRYLLQKIDCNCNDCKFMVRDMEKFNKWKKWQIDQGYDKFSRINYGRCTKLNKDVSFIPNVCQIETQECFVHRKD
jgi:hypothetical protein